jgi:hypothetical protein
MVAILLSLALVSCGGADDAPRPEPAPQRSTAPPYSPDAGIPQGHSVADARAHRCRATHSARYCDRYAR